MWLMGEEVSDGIEMANEWMKLEEDGVIWHPRCGFRLRPHFLIRHGEILVLNAAKAEQEKTRSGGWFGHGHRRRTWYEEIPDLEEAFSTMMSPVMSRRDYDYGPGGSGIAPWPQGFLVGTFSTTDEYDYETDIARWWKGRLLLRGVRY
ncbi:MAG: hypothetical protein JWM90_3113 [Thermoleophilia bacterium]|nr:hypothetical protein [Thermoleophilia bacterium]